MCEKVNKLELHLSP